MTKKTRKTAAEYLAEKAADKDHVEMWKAKDEDLGRRQVEWAAAEVPIVAALRAIGLDVSSVWDLVNTADPYPEAVPVLFDHLHKPYPERVVEGIIRALAVPESQSRWDELLQFFEAASSKEVGGLRWVAGCALDAAADDSVIDEVIRLVRDPRYGFDRAALFPSLARSNDARAKMLLHELRDDPVLGKEVKKLRRMRRKSGE
jgi:hypothetical protein